MIVKMIAGILALMYFASFAAQAQTDEDDYLIRVCRAAEVYACGYANAAGDTVVPVDKYVTCFSDTFRHYAIVLTKPEAGYSFYLINRKEEVVGKVFIFDNGPDPVSDGLFRICSDPDCDSIGYASMARGIVIPPVYPCALPFQNGVAKVALKCKTVREAGGEHWRWESDAWFHIDKQGRRVD